MKNLLPLSLVVACFTSGCTYRLWETESFRCYRYPSPDPKLVVLDDRAHADFIACYDEVSDSKGTVERRAYRVIANGDVTERGKPPQFLKQTPTNLVALPTNNRGGNPPCVTETNGVFTVHSTNGLVGPTRLPTYVERSGVPTKIALTPVTVLVDATIVGLVVGAYMPGLWTSHVNTH